jgi:hypothetical protein
MLWMGSKDHLATDKPMDAATRAMRYSAVTTSYLWDVLKEDRTEVSSEPPAFAGSSFAS